MVRTADNALRVAGGKSTRKGGNVSTRQESSRSRSPAGGSGDRGGGLNPVCPRETPSWQRPITTFFTVVEKSQQDNVDVHNKPGSSTNANVADDINMTEIDNQGDPQPSCGSKQSIEAMDEEFHEIKIDKTENDKENETNAANTINNRKVLPDTEMEDIGGNAKKKVNARDDDEEMAPPKRIKLDKNIYEHLQELEQS